MQAVSFDPPPSRIETEVRRVRAMLERSEFAPALQAALRLREEVPENRDVLYMIAVAQRYLQQIPDAFATLQRLEELHPDYPRLYQERGHCHVGSAEIRQAGHPFTVGQVVSPRRRGRGGWHGAS